MHHPTRGATYVATMWTTYDAERRRRRAASNAVNVRDVPAPDGGHRPAPELRHVEDVSVSDVVRSTTGREGSPPPSSESSPDSDPGRGTCGMSSKTTSQTSRVAPNRATSVSEELYLVQFVGELCS